MLTHMMDKANGTRALKRILLVILGLPALSAVAGLVLAATVLHPIHRGISAEQVREADAVFGRVGATREEFAVRAPDGVILRGWKVRAAGLRESEGSGAGTAVVSVLGGGAAIGARSLRFVPDWRRGTPVGMTNKEGEWVLLLHGRSHNRMAMMAHAEFLLEAGYNVVMMDARRHGESGGNISTYGYLEARDETAIVDALEDSEQVNHLFALGESMGAAVSLQAAATEPRIEAVVAEGAFRNLREVTYDYAGLQESETLGKTVFRTAAEVSRLIAEREGGFQFETISPEKAVAKREFAVLLICGKSDRKIPCRHSEAIFGSAVGRKELWMVPDTGHEKAIETHEAEFRERVLRLFAEAGG